MAKMHHSYEGIRRAAPGGKEGVLLHGFCLLRSSREGCECVILGHDHKVAVDDNR